MTAFSVVKLLVTRLLVPTTVPFARLTPFENIDIRSNPNVIAYFYFPRRINHIMLVVIKRMAVIVTKIDIPAEKNVLTESDFLVAVNEAVYIAGKFISQTDFSA